MFATLKMTDPRSASEQAAYGKWLDQRTDREEARADRTHGAEGVIPDPLWIVLFVSAGIIFVFMLFFADSAERAIVQATMIGSVAIVITSTLLLLWFLDHPYHRGLGALRPVAMERTLYRPDVPVVYISGYARGDAVLSASSASDAGPFLEKPFTPAELVAVVRRVAHPSSGGQR